jgi:hypothetical protein
MPSVQRGQVYRKPSGTWAFRFRDESGQRREVAKFATRTEASRALDETLRSFASEGSASAATSLSKSSWTSFSRSTLPRRTRSGR